MVLLDVNVLISAHKQDNAQHAVMRDWLSEFVQSNQPFGIPDLCWNGFLRIATHPNVFKPPSEPDEAFRFLEALRDRPHYMPCTPGSGHWVILRALCRKANIRGDLFTDAYLAALAIESNSDLVSADTDFARFPGLKWRNPLNERK